MTDGTNKRKRLRLLTYMCPDLPLQTFALLRNCIEATTQRETDLMVEDRFSGPTSDRANPFDDDTADIVAVHSTDYLRMKENGQRNMQLCPVAPVFQHPLASGRPVYFSEIIIHARNKDKYKSLMDLKGCSWAYTDNSSLSGNLIVLKHLKNELKTNASYFGTVVASGSHRNSIRMVRDATVEAAAVDSTVLSSYLREHEDYSDKFISLVSLGPLPIFPILFNSRLPDATKEKITEGFLAASKLDEVGIEKFSPVTPDLYFLEKDVTERVKGMSINAAYY